MRPQRCRHSPPTKVMPTANIVRLVAWTASLAECCDLLLHFPLTRP